MGFFGSEAAAAAAFPFRAQRALLLPRVLGALPYSVAPAGRLAPAGPRRHLVLRAASFSPFCPPRPRPAPSAAGTPVGARAARGPTPPLHRVSFSTSAPASESINQIMRKGRYIQRRRYFIQFKRQRRSPALEGCPQKKGVVIKVFTMRPKKPNSAVRKVALVRLSTGKEVVAYIPGIGHRLQEHNVVLVRGGGPRDLVGVKYRLCRGALDFAGVVGCRNHWRKFGAKKPEEKKGKRYASWTPFWRWHLKKEEN